MAEFQNFEFLDQLVVLKPENFNYSIEWRTQQERNNSQGMTDEKIAQFVLQSLRSLPPDIYYRDIEKRCDILVEFDLNRKPTRILLKE